MVWSSVKKMMWAEKQRLARSLLEETEGNLRSLSENSPLRAEMYRNARGADQLALFSPEMQKQLARAYEKVDTINDALLKYHDFSTTRAGTEGYEKTRTEFQQFIAWYRGGLGASLQQLKDRLADDLKERPDAEREDYTP